ncbi:HAD hydrolase-like protein [Jeotgalibaca porci]|uniref:HAD hydrolase-like protein n=2 Tax=Jeotgalibaca porci TaxID=1868793 RepID=UPI00359FA97A
MVAVYMQIKSIIFDLDGLLINSEIVPFEIYKELLAQHQHNFTLENYAQNYSGRSSILNMENPPKKTDSENSKSVFLLY